MTGFLANKMGVAGIFRVHSDTAISQHGLGTRCGDFNGLIGAFDRVLGYVSAELARDTVGNSP